MAEAPSELMEIGGGLKIQRNHYLASFKGTLKPLGASRSSWVVGEHVEVLRSTGEWSEGTVVHVASGQVKVSLPGGSEKTIPLQGSSTHLRKVRVQQLPKKMLSRQCDGHDTVAMRQSAPKGEILKLIPNETVVTCSGRLESGYSEVDLEIDGRNLHGWIKQENLVDVSYPTVERPDLNVSPAFDGTIDDVFKANPELNDCCYNDIKQCNKCGKPCAFTMTICNSCGAELPEEISQSENVFSAFLFGVKLAKKGFPYLISLRSETDDVLIFDDMLQLSPCHLNGIPKNFYIPDWRYLLLSPAEGLKLLNLIEAELWSATKVFLKNEGFRTGLYREGVTEDLIRSKIVASFNFPPSQFQMHVQWIVPPHMPFQHFMAESRNHYHHGRAFPLDYVKKVLALDKPYKVEKNTKIEDITEYYTKEGVSYDEIWKKWYESVGVGGSIATQNWHPDDFEYLVKDGEVHKFTIHDGVVTPGEKVEGLKHQDIQVKDKAALQNYGRPYDDKGKPSGTYIQKPLQQKWGSGGYVKWPPGLSTGGYA